MSAGYRSIGQRAHSHSLGPLVLAVAAQLLRPRTSRAIERLAHVPLEALASAPAQAPRSMRQNAARATFRRRCLRCAALRCAAQHCAALRSIAQHCSSITTLTTLTYPCATQQDPLQVLYERFLPLWRRVPLFARLWRRAEPGERLCMRGRKMGVESAAAGAPVRAVHARLSFFLSRS